MHGQEPFLTWIQDVANTTNAPFVFSVSYGDVESSLDVGYMERINQEFQIVGARGGVGAIVQCGLTRCRHLDHVRVGRLWRRLQVERVRTQVRLRSTNASIDLLCSFPVSSPYVTGVGATQLINNNQAEEACLTDFAHVHV